LHTPLELRNSPPSLRLGQARVQPPQDDSGAGLYCGRRPQSCSGALPCASLSERSEWAIDGHALASPRRRLRRRGTPRNARPDRQNVLDERAKILCAQAAPCVAAAAVPAELTTPCLAVSRLEACPQGGAVARRAWRSIQNIVPEHGEDIVAAAKVGGWCAALETSTKEPDLWSSVGEASGVGGRRPVTLPQHVRPD
jgi:hypothetical protein